MNKLLKLILILCLLVIPMLQICAQSATTLEKPSASDYGIKLEQYYLGTDILELVMVLEQEALVAIDEAYAAGYKAGVIAHAPDSSYWQSRAQDAERLLAHPQFPWIETGIAFSAGAMLATISILVLLAGR